MSYPHSAVAGGAAAGAGCGAGSGSGGGSRDDAAAVILEWARNSVENPSMKDIVLNAVRNSDCSLRTVLKDLFEVCLDAYVAPEAGDIDWVIFNNLLQREDTQRYLGNSYIWDNAKLFKLPQESFNFFVQKFFFVSDSTVDFAEHMVHRFRLDLMRVRSTSEVKECQQKLLNGLLALEDVDCRKAILEEALRPGTRLASFLGDKSFKKELEGALQALKVKGSLTVQASFGAFLVYTSSSHDRSYAAETKEAQRKQKEAGEGSALALFDAL